MLQTNAQLTSVHAATPSGEGFDGPQAAGPEKWSGSADVYLRERRNRRQVLEGSDVELDTVMLVDRDNPRIDWRIGDVVTFTRAGAAGAETNTVRGVEQPTISDPDIDTDVVTFRLTLQAR